MADARFFTSAGPFSVDVLTEKNGIEARDENMLLSGLASLSAADSNHLSFFSNIKLQAELAATNAGAVLVKAEHAALVPPQSLALICDDPYRSMAEITQMFFPDAARSRPPRGAIAESNIHPDAVLGDNVVLEPNVVIGAGAEIGDGCHIGAHSFIGHGVVLGRDCTIGAHTSITYALIGDRVIVHGGTNIGCDGFGFAPGAAHIKIPQLGRVIVQADVEIGGNAAIDRGALADTVIGEGSKLDNLVHIAHNVQLGRHCFITASCAVAGSTTLGDYVQMGGGAKVTGHVEIGDRCVISANAAVLRSFPADSQIAGSPGRLRSALYRDQAFISHQRKQAEKSKKAD
jgi:UDP-3-O-[3-hydroxymyristoyl] glucosamine N-acyltransferase